MAGQHPFPPERAYCNSIRSHSRRKDPLFSRSRYKNSNSFRRNSNPPFREESPFSPPMSKPALCLISPSPEAPFPFVRARVVTLFSSNTIHTAPRFLNQHLLPPLPPGLDVLLPKIAHPDWFSPFPPFFRLMIRQKLEFGPMSGLLLPLSDGPPKSEIPPTCTVSSPFFFPHKAQKFLLLSCVTVCP